jgi:hypothetical protein
LTHVLDVEPSLDQTEFDVCTVQAYRVTNQKYGLFGFADLSLVHPWMFSSAFTPAGLTCTTKKSICSSDSERNITICSSPAKINNHHISNRTVLLIYCSTVVTDNLSH